MRLVEMNEEEKVQYESYVQWMLREVTISICPTNYSKDDSGFVEQNLLMKFKGIDVPIVGIGEINIPWDWIQEGFHFSAKDADDYDDDDFDDGSKDNDDNGDYANCSGELPPSLWDNPDLWRKMGL